MTGDNAGKIELQVFSHAEQLKAATASELQHDHSLNFGALDPDKKIAAIEKLLKRWV